MTIITSKTGMKKITETSKTLCLEVIRDFNTAKHKVSNKFLECVGDNFFVSEDGNKQGYSHFRIDSDQQGGIDSESEG